LLIKQFSFNVIGAALAASGKTGGIIKRHAVLYHCCAAFASFHAKVIYPTATIVASAGEASSLFLGGETKILTSGSAS